MLLTNFQSQQDLGTKIFNSFNLNNVIWILWFLSDLIMCYVFFIQNHYSPLWKQCIFGIWTSMVIKLITKPWVHHRRFTLFLEILKLFFLRIFPMIFWLKYSDFHFHMFINLYFINIVHWNRIFVCIQNVYDKNFGFPERQKSKKFTSCFFVMKTSAFLFECRNETNRPWLTEDFCLSYKLLNWKLFNCLAFGMVCDIFTEI